jgi:septal ring factor EnvC (AmiA/AmiB activator)
VPILNNTFTCRSPSASNDSTVNGCQPVFDDQRKQQIRDSNREAARRCRERRRQYIEQLEGNLEQHKIQIKQLNEKLTRTERENTQLRTLLTEADMFQLRHSSNDTMLDFPHIINSNNNFDANQVQRNFVTRSTH